MADVANVARQRQPALPARFGSGSAAHTMAMTGSSRPATGNRRGWRVRHPGMTLSVDLLGAAVARWSFGGTNTSGAVRTVSDLRHGSRAHSGLPATPTPSARYSARRVPPTRQPAPENTDRSGCGGQSGTCVGSQGCAQRGRRRSETRFREPGSLALAVAPFAFQRQLAAAPDDLDQLGLRFQRDRTERDTRLLSGLIRFAVQVPRFPMQLTSTGCFEPSACTSSSAAAPSHTRSQRERSAYPLASCSVSATSPSAARSARPAGSRLPPPKRSLRSPASVSTARLLGVRAGNSQGFHGRRDIAVVDLRRPYLLGSPARCFLVGAPGGRKLLYTSTLRSMPSGSMRLPVRRASAPVPDTKDSVGFRVQWLLQVL